jgi:hypothetical protein
MMGRQDAWLWLTMLMVGLCVSSATAGGERTAAVDPNLQGKQTEIPWNQLPPWCRARMHKVIQHATLACAGPTEAFQGQTALYQWLLDHPDQAVRMWRRLGANCLQICDLGNGRFGWNDGEGSEVHWDTVYQSDHLRIWYAEGHLRPASLLPAVPARAVVVLHYGELEGTSRRLIRHQADLYVQTDSKAAVLAAKLLGASVPRLGQQCIGQLELFFSALVWYLDRHPDLIPAEGPRPKGPDPKSQASKS